MDPVWILLAFVLGLIARQLGQPPLSLSGPGGYLRACHPAQNLATPGQP